MKQYLGLLILAIHCTPFLTAQNVGIGTTVPKARLALNGGLVIDQLDLNQGVLDVNNTNALFFGSDMKTGILNNRTPGQVSRSGLGFVTGGNRRMIIDSLGRVAINATTNINYRLFVSGSTYSDDAVVGNTMEVNGRLSVNSSNHTALLYLKGILPSNDWGQHIIMENKSNASYGSIMYDDGGMKMRNFSAGNRFYFRNSANESSMIIDDDGNITNNGDGLVVNSGSTQLKTYLYSGALLKNLNPGSSVRILIAFPAFASVPYVSLSQVAEGTGSYDKVVYNVTDVTTTTAVIAVYNPTDVVAAIDGLVKAIIVGAK
jgi:hypothetical protein